MMRLNERLTSGAFLPGVYQLAGDLEATEVDTAVSAAGWHGVVLDGRGVVDKAGLLTAVAEAFNFPSYFGHNWDALDEMLTDLSWLPAAGYVIILDDFETLAQVAPQTWQMFLTIWREATAVWWADGVPMFVLVRGAAGQTCPSLVDE